MKPLALAGMLLCVSTVACADLDALEDGACSDDPCRNIASDAAAGVDVSATTEAAGPTAADAPAPSDSGSTPPTATTPEAAAPDGRSSGVVPEASSVVPETSVEAAPDEGAGCLGLEVDCTATSTCCSGLFCDPGPQRCRTCQPSGQSCDFDAQCCSGMCRAGNCT